MYLQRLNELREGMSLKQVQIDKLLNISQSVYSRYEKGYKAIPGKHILILADFYNVSTDYILGRTNNKEPLK